MRWEAEGAVCHIIAGGNERKAVFRDDRDRQEYVDRLMRCRERFGLRLLALPDGAMTRFWRSSARVGDDVAQEVFVKISRFLETLDDRSKLSSWVYAITLNTVRDAARKRSARPVPITESRELAGADNDEPTALASIADGSSRSPEERAMRDEMVACYLDYVNQLPRKYFEVYVLSELEGLSNDEIARRLSLSRGSARSRFNARAVTRGHAAISTSPRPGRRSSTPHHANPDQPRDTAVQNDLGSRIPAGPSY